MKFVDAEQAVSIVESGHRVFVHTAAAAPQLLVQALTARAPSLSDVDMIHLHTEGDAPYADPDVADVFHTNALFVGANVRKAVQQGEADYIPVFLSEVPALFRNGILSLDAALLQVSPPDKHGFCSLGVSVDVSRAALEMAEPVVVQINPTMPRTHGDGLIHISQIDLAVEANGPIPEISPTELRDIERRIGQHCASLIDNGATLQMGRRRWDRGSSAAGPRRRSRLDRIDQ